MKPDVLIVGGGMISREVIFPTIFQEQRYGRVGNISVSSLTGSIIKELQGMFPKFKGYPDPDKTSSGIYVSHFTLHESHFERPS